MCNIEEKQFATYCTFKVLPSHFLATKENDGLTLFLRYSKTVKFLRTVSVSRLLEISDLENKTYRIEMQ